MTTLNKLLIFLAVIISFGFGFIAGVAIDFQKKEAPLVVEGVILEQKIENGIFIFMADIKNITDDSIYVELSRFGDFDRLEPKDRVVKISDETEIFQLVNKNLEQYFNEWEEFEKESRNKFLDPASIDVIVPQPQEKNKIDVFGLKAGQLITVITDTDMRDLEDIFAVQIMVQP